MSLKENNIINGISYLVDDQGQRSAVVVDLAVHGEIWADFHDALTAKEHQYEPLESWKDVLKRFQRIDNADMGQ